MYQLYSYTKLPVVAIPCACVELLARNRSPVASRSPPATILLQRSHTCIYYREMGVNGMLSTVIRSHGNFKRTVPCSARFHVPCERNITLAFSKALDSDKATHDTY